MRPGAGDRPDVPDRTDPLDPKDLPYRAALFPLGPVVALAMCLVVVVGQGWSYFTDPVSQLPGILATYLGLPLFLALWWGHKLVTRAPRCVRGSVPG